MVNCLGSEPVHQMLQPQLRPIDRTSWLRVWQILTGYRVTPRPASGVAGKPAPEDEKLKSRYLGAGIRATDLQNDAITGHGSCQQLNAQHMRMDSMAIKRSTEQALADFLQENPKWIAQTGKLHREFVFMDFCEAFGFMSEIALVAERNDHHPEWFNVYKKVVVELTTHEAGGITQRDFELAARMSEVAARRACTDTKLEQR